MTDDEERRIANQLARERAGWTAEEIARDDQWLADWHRAGGPYKGGPLGTGSYQGGPILPPPGEPQYVPEDEIPWAGESQPDPVWTKRVLPGPRPSRPEPKPSPTPARIPPEELEDLATVIQQGQEIAANGVQYLVEGLIPDYGMLGFLVAFAKVGKTTWGQQLTAAIAMKTEFLGRSTRGARVLILAAEDPPEYTAYLARHLIVDPGRALIRRLPLTLGKGSLERIVATIAAEGIGFVWGESWQALIRGLVERGENDNSGQAMVTEEVKAAARESHVPWLIDAHSGKGEDQGDDADPLHALRGASSAAGAVDFIISLRYANGTFGTQRRLSAKGRFVNVAPETLDYDPVTSQYILLGDSKSAALATDWQLICDTGALTEVPQTPREIAILAGMAPAVGKMPGGVYKRLLAVFRWKRDEVGHTDEVRRGKKASCWFRMRV